MTLKELYENVLVSQEWKYYKTSSLSFSLKDLDNSCVCKNFIETMIMCGGKNDHYLSKCIGKVDPTRLQHIVSCFLSGFIFYSQFSCIRDSIKKMLDNLPFPEKRKKKIINVLLIFGFLFVYFMI